MREAIEAALAMLAASAILWAVEPAPAQVQNHITIESAGEANGY